MGITVKNENQIEKILEMSISLSNLKMILMRSQNILKIKKKERRQNLQTQICTTKNLLTDQSLMINKGMKIMNKAKMIQSSHQMIKTAKPTNELKTFEIAKTLNIMKKMM